MIKSFKYSTILTVGLLFLTITFQNAILSLDFGIVPLREIDDYAIFSSLYDLYYHIEAERWSSVASFTPYAYGAGFWYLMGLLLFPFFKLGDPQLFVIAGREVATIFGFMGLYVLYKIAFELTRSQILSYTAVLLAALSSALIFWSQKCHVNTLYMFFGLLAFYYLIKGEQPTRRHLFYSSIFGGIMVGLKLTGIFLVPMLLFVLISRLKHLGLKEKIARVTKFVATSFLVGMFVCAPIFGAFPFFYSQCKGVVNALLFFGKLGTPKTLLPDPGHLFEHGITHYYLSGLVLFILTIVFGIFTWRRYKAGDFLPLSLLAGYILPLIAVTCLVRKGAVYTSAYFLGVGILLPLLVWGLKSFKVSNKFLPLICILLIGYEISAQSQYINNALLLNYHRKSQAHIIEGLRVFKAMSLVEFLLPEGRPVRLLREYNTVFPIHKFNSKVDEAFNYWNLTSKKDGRWDYIVLNVKNWKPDNLPLEATQRETLIRNTLINENMFFGVKYKSIFAKHEIRVFKKNETQD